MQKTKSDFKVLSMLLLFLAALDAVRIISNLVKNVNATPQAVANMAPELVKIAVIIAGVVSLALLLPDIFLGVRGIKIANGAEVTGRGHIIWAKVLLVFSIIAAVLAVFDLFGSSDILMSLLSLATAAIDVFIYIFYIKYANALRAAQ